MRQMWNERSLVTYMSYDQALVDLYQASIKGKCNLIKTNFINGQGTMDPDDPYQVSLQEANNQINDNFIDNDGAIPLTHFDISNFF